MLRRWRSSRRGRNAKSSSSLSPLAPHSQPRASSGMAQSHSRHHIRAGPPPPKPANPLGAATSRRRHMALPPPSPRPLPRIGKDAFHRVPVLLLNIRDLVEQVPTQIPRPPRNPKLSGTRRPSNPQLLRGWRRPVSTRPTPSQRPSSVRHFPCPFPNPSSKP